MTLLLFLGILLLLTGGTAAAVALTRQIHRAAPPWVVAGLAILHVSAVSGAVYLGVQLSRVVGYEAYMSGFVYLLPLILVLGVVLALRMGRG